MLPTLRAAITLLVLTSAAPLDAAGQKLELSLAAGASFPTGDVGEFRDNAASFSASVGYRLADMFVARLGLDTQMFRDGEGVRGAQELSSQRGDLRVSGISAQIDWQATDDAIQSWLMLSIGSYRLRVPGRANPYGRTGAISAGIGMQGDISARAVFFTELRRTLQLTDYGTSGDFVLPAYWTVLAGLRWRPGRIESVE